MNNTTFDVNRKMFMTTKCHFVEQNSILRFKTTNERGR